MAANIILRRALPLGLRARPASTTFVRHFADAAEGSETKLNLNFVVPYQAIKKNSFVDMVTIPASSGEMGVLPQHVPTVAQMKPGVVTVVNGDKIEKYFVSSGFAFIHKDRTDVCAVEAVDVHDIDPVLVQQGLDEANALLNSTSDELIKAEAQIGIDVYTAMQAVIPK